MSFYKAKLVIFFLFIILILKFYTNENDGINKKKVSNCNHKKGF